MSKIIIVNPHTIKKMSPVAGCANSRKKKAHAIGCVWKNGYLYGDWDKTEKTLAESLTPKDYKLFIDGKQSVYDWKRLQDSIQKNGYIQDPNNRYVEVGLGRTGELFLVDGRHRLFLAQVFNIKEIPVQILDVHNLYKGKLHE